MKGNLEVLDLDTSGLAIGSYERWSYRDAVACTGPPDPPPWNCNWLRNTGNTIALEWAIDTVSSTDLTTTDRLYLADHNYAQSRLRVLELGHPGAALSPAFGADVDMSDGHMMLANGVEGLAMGGAADVLYVATGLQSFEEGIMGSVDTTANTPSGVLLPFRDHSQVWVDPLDPRRFFAVTSDAFVETPAVFDRHRHHPKDACLHERKSPGDQLGGCGTDGGRRGGGHDRHGRLG